MYFTLIQTPEEHTDHRLLSEAITVVEELIHMVDVKAGEAKCQYTKEKLDYLEDKQRSHLIDDSQAVLCDGILKNNRGTVSLRHIFKRGVYCMSSGLCA